MAQRNLVQTPLPKMKEVDTWKGVEDIDKSTVAFRGRDMGTSYDVYESSSKPLVAHHVEGDEWETGVIDPSDIHLPEYMKWSWPINPYPIRFGR
jgi:hypothetical protein